MAEEVYSFSATIRMTARQFDNFARRLFDILVSAGLLFGLAPFIGLIAMAIRRDTPGPVFYRGRRIGLGGKIFEILKFRTMYEDPASYQGLKITSHDDPRITPLGRWLRNTKLNELPQLWNVLKGDMSLVGPRPEDPEIAQKWPKEVWEDILSVRPGITSPASVQFHDEESLLSCSNVLQKYIQELGPNKNRMDRLYVHHRSFWLDLDTLFWTLMILLPKIGAQIPPEELLFVGPFTRLIRRYFNWFIIDLLVTLGSIGLAGLVWRVSGPLDVGWPKSIAIALGFSLIFSLTGAILGINRISWSKATYADGYDLLPAWILAAIIANLSNEIVHIFPNKMILAATLLALCGYVGIRFRKRLINSFNEWALNRWSAGTAGRERVLIIGSGATAQHAAWLLEHPSNARKYWLAGFIDDDLFKQGMRIYGSSVIGKVKDIPDLVKRYDVGMVIHTGRRSEAAHCLELLEMSHQPQAKLLHLPDFLFIFNNLVNTVPMIPVTAEADSDAPGDYVEDEMPCLQCMTRYATLENRPQNEEIE